MLARRTAARNQLTISPVRLTLSPSLTRRSEPKSTTPTWPASRFMHMPLTPEANLQRVSSTQDSMQDRMRHTRQAPQPGRSPSRGHARYHHCRGLVSIAIPNSHPKFHPTIPQTRPPWHPRPWCWTPNLLCCCPSPRLPCVRAAKRTRRRGRGQSRRGWTPPGRREFSAREWTTPRSARPSHRRMCGFGGPRRWVRHFAVGDQLA